MFAEYVPPDYVTARGRFRETLANRARVESLTVPGGPDLTMDVARLGPANAERLLIVSSGLHGSEGPFGSGVQLALLNRPWPADVPLLLIHARNPFGIRVKRGRGNGRHADFLGQTQAERGVVDVGKARDVGQ